MNQGNLLVIKIYSRSFSFCRCKDKNFGAAFYIEEQDKFRDGDQVFSRLENASIQNSIKLNYFRIKSGESFRNKILLNVLNDENLLYVY